jgi:hypothetical protein
MTANLWGHVSKRPLFFIAGLTVRIRFPPAGSLSQR